VAAPPPVQPMNGSTARSRTAAKSEPAVGVERTTDAPCAGRSWHALRWIVAVALLASIGQTVAIGQHIQATFGDLSNTLYQSSLHQLQVTMFLRVAVAAIAFWLVLLRRRAGVVIAVALGVVTVLFYTISFTGPTDPGPTLAPPWLYALGILAAVVMTLGGALALRRG